MQNKIPPPVITLLNIYIIYSINQVFPKFYFPYQSIVSIFVGIEAVLIIFFAIKEFKKAATTISPLQINQVSSFVTTGIFRFTRNPMYLGLTSLQVAAGIYFGNWLMVVVVPMFIFYITFYQIIPEEKVLNRKFGNDFKIYCSKVGRWL
tara:strand:- start:10 stop:456 length:447 start_codon:yes stop_codon:yes gene_type:complete